MQSVLTFQALLIHHRHPIMATPAIHRLQAISIPARILLIRQLAYRTAAQAPIHLCQAPVHRQVVVHHIRHRPATEPIHQRRHQRRRSIHPHPAMATADIHQRPTTDRHILQLQIMDLRILQRRVIHQLQVRLPVDILQRQVRMRADIQELDTVTVRHTVIPCLYYLRVSAFCRLSERRPTSSRWRLWSKRIR